MTREPRNAITEKISSNSGDSAQTRGIDAKISSIFLKSPENGRFPGNRGRNFVYSGREPDFRQNRSKSFAYSTCGEEKLACAPF
jgi:hypothetical protein